MTLLMSNAQELLDDEQFPYSGVPSKYFCSVSLRKNDEKPFTDDEYLEVREDLMSLLVPYPVLFTFPVNYTNKRKHCIMLCFECSRRYKEMIELLLDNYCSSLRKYRSTFLFESL